jgi:hypothetical protein
MPVSKTKLHHAHDLSRLLEENPMQSQCSKEDAVQCSEEEDAKALPTLSYFSGGGLRHCADNESREAYQACAAKEI